MQNTNTLESSCSPLHERERDEIKKEKNQVSVDTSSSLNYAKIIGCVLLFAAVILVVIVTVLPMHPNDTLESQSSDPLLVKTSAGSVQGFVMNVSLPIYSVQGSADHVAIHAWRGIPYAEKPSGQLRWQPPAPAAPWSGTLLCKEFRSQCVQPLGDPMSTGGEGSEDCLFLNIYGSTGSVGSSGPYPVLFYIHGGERMSLLP